jgi:hypothetical protein
LPPETSTALSRAGLRLAPVKSFVHLIKEPIRSWAWWYMPVIPPTSIWEVEVRGLWSEAGQGKRKRSYVKKQTKSEWTGGMAQGVESLPRKSEALHSNRSLGPSHISF